MTYATKFQEKEGEAETENPEHCSTMYTFVPTEKYPAETCNYFKNLNLINFNFNLKEAWYLYRTDGLQCKHKKKMYVLYLLM